MIELDLWHILRVAGLVARTFYFIFVVTLWLILLQWLKGSIKNARGRKRPPLFRLNLSLLALLLCLLGTSLLLWRFSVTGRLLLPSTSNQSHRFGVEEAFGSRGLMASGNERIKALGEIWKKRLKEAKGRCRGDERRDFEATPVRLAVYRAPKEPRRIVDCDVPCFETSDTSLDYDGILFLIGEHWDLTVHFTNAFHCAHKIQWTMESEANYPYLLDGVVFERGTLTTMDVMCSTRLDSTVPLVYLNEQEFNFFAPPLPYLKKRTDALAVAVISNCWAGRYGESMDRLEIIDWLLWFGVAIHSYGKCRHNKDWPAEEITKINLIRQYKFTLAFENSFSLDYVTEKIGDALSAGSVPVYLGTESVEIFAPKSSYIDIASYKTVRDLATDLIRIGNDPDEYAKYLEWKNPPKEKNFVRVMNATSRIPPMCQLCHLMKRQLET
jgi:hypothetical protein